MFSSLFSRRSGTYANLLDKLKDGKKSLKELAELLNRKLGGDLVKNLKELEEAGFIQRSRQWNLNEPSKGELFAIEFLTTILGFI